MPAATKRKGSHALPARVRVFRSIEQLSLRAATTAEPLPDGVCGRITGVALVYGVADDYGTVFEPGCLAKTRTERVATGKVQLFADHGPFTDTHVGVVRAIEDVGDAAVMTADLFDTDAGRAMKDYVEKVIAAGATTGLSIGFRPRAKEWKQNGDEYQCHYQEIELRETSITPVPAVPGADVMSVRRSPDDEEEDDPGLLVRALEGILSALPERDARAVVDRVYARSAGSTDTSGGTADGASAGETPAGDPARAPGSNAALESETASGAEAPKKDEPALASEEDRIRAVRSALQTT